MRCRYSLETQSDFDQDHDGVEYHSAEGAHELARGILTTFTSVIWIKFHMYFIERYDSVSDSWLINDLCISFTSWRDLTWPDIPEFEFELSYLTHNYVIFGNWKSTIIVLDRHAHGLMVRCLVVGIMQGLCAKSHFQRPRWPCYCGSKRWTYQSKEKCGKSDLLGNAFLGLDSDS